MNHVFEQPLRQHLCPRWTLQVDSLPTDIFHTDTKGCAIEVCEREMPNKSRREKKFTGDADSARLPKRQRCTMDRPPQESREPLAAFAPLSSQTSPKHHAAKVRCSEEGIEEEEEEAARFYGKFIARHFGSLCDSCSRSAAGVLPSPPSAPTSPMRFPRSEVDLRRGGQRVLKEWESSVLQRVFGRGAGVHLVPWGLGRILRRLRKTATITAETTAKLPLCLAVGDVPWIYDQPEGQSRTFLSNS